MTTSVSPVATAPASAPTTPPVTLLVVDDHTLFRRGLIALLSQYEGLSVVGEAGMPRRPCGLRPSCSRR